MLLSIAYTTFSLSKKEIAMAIENKETKFRIVNEFHEHNLLASFIKYSCE
ncbi:MAG: hypothetical protein WCI91_02795 [Candidatus Nomurabacteria bacterium]